MVIIWDCIWYKLGTAALSNTRSFNIIFLHAKFHVNMILLNTIIFINRLAGRQADRQAGKQADRQAGRQAGRYSLSDMFSYRAIFFGWAIHTPLIHQSNNMYIFTWFDVLESDWDLPIGINSHLDILTLKSFSVQVWYQICKVIH